MMAYPPGSVKPINIACEPYPGSEQFSPEKRTGHDCSSHPFWETAVGQIQKRLFDGDNALGCGVDTPCGKGHRVLA
jgi:hypothetical protein